MLLYYFSKAYLFRVASILSGMPVGLCLERALLDGAASATAVATAAFLVPQALVCLEAAQEAQEALEQAGVKLVPPSEEEETTEMQPSQGKAILSCIRTAICCCGVLLLLLSLKRVCFEKGSGV